MDGYLNSGTFAMKDKKKLGKTKWEYLIMDEAQRIKNSKSKLASSLTKHFKSKHRVLLSGTPLQVTTELHSLATFVICAEQPHRAVVTAEFPAANGIIVICIITSHTDSQVFDSSDNFDQWFNAPFAADVDIDEEEKLLIILRLHQVTTVHLY